MAVDLKKLKNEHCLLTLKAIFFVNLWYKNEDKLTF